MGQNESSSSFHRGAPRISGPRLVGVRPGTPLLHYVAAAGAVPRTWSASGLPTGLSLDPESGILTGRLDAPGERSFRVEVANGFGSDEATLRIVAGDRLALTPPMGWMSWNMFGRDIDEQLIRETADAMVASGMRDVGYQYVCIDDYWHGERDASGTLQPDPARFPNGIRALADYVHGRGLKLGIYSDAGTMTCGRQPGSFGFEEQDAATFASWGIDYLKYDYCHAPPERDVAVERYSKMGQALRDTGRSIVFAICEWGGRRPWEWAADAGGHLWRTTGDIADAWTMGDTGWMGIIDALDRQEGLDRFAGRGWHDPDMLLAGLHGRGAESSRADGATGCTDAEYRSQVSLWAVLGAPLLTSCDLRTMDNTTIATLTNAELIAISQDPLGAPGRRLGRMGELDVWAREMSERRQAFALLNRGESPLEASVRLPSLGLTGRHELRDAWAHEVMRFIGDGFTLRLEPHATSVLVAAPLD